MIQLRNVEKRFAVGRQQHEVLREISLDVWPGEFITIMGPSGAGKTTLLSILGMLDGEFTGEYWFGDQPVHKLRPEERQRLARENIGFVFQQYHLLDDLTVHENLALPLSYRGVKAATAAGLVADTLDRFQIVGKKDLFPRQLSGGQQQLVAVARAVIASPKVILADEPTGNLHSQQGREVMELFTRLNAEGTTIIQVTHSEENARYSRRTVYLHDGWIRRDEMTTPETSVSTPTGAGAVPSA
ncbi:MAG TPA: ABC transporter ATP-binding protein [Phycisphaerae bacterium]|nr:ABC transporter ATP-binding protein [Phycisphaerae bacterium]HNU44254.1 ABC transporter ATP-binding protein [Phycisphaerae bacterium]